MAETGRREEVGDPLALNPNAQRPDRSLATIGVRNPGQTGGDAVSRDQMNALGALGQLSSALGAAVEKEQDDWYTKGQLAFAQGTTEAEIAASGNKYTMQGWQSMNAADSANRFYASELASLENGGNQLDPNEYTRLLNERRAAYLTDLPDDPVVRKVYMAAFNDVGPRLVAAQTAAHNDWNHTQLVNETANVLSSGAYTNADASRVMPGGSPLAISPGVVRETVSYTDADVEALAYTILGEAAGEGPTGMAAVAHVALNRAIDTGQPLANVVKEPYQFSTWNSPDQGGNNPTKFKGTRQFEQARDIALTVLSGHNVDPTGGAKHFLAEGSLSKLPSWWNSAVAESGGTIRIGGHTFAGKGVHAPAGAGGSLVFKNKGQESLEPTFANALSSTGVALGIDLTINSGRRSAEHNKAVGGANESRHVHGDAADIDMSGMTDEQRYALVQTLRSNGVVRFGTYDNEPNMLHADMSNAQGGNWFMHNRSNGNMDKAPDWFKKAQADVATGAVTGLNIPKQPSKDGELTVGQGASAGAVADARGVVTDETPSGAQTQLQQYIRVSPLPKSELATVLAGEIIKDFEQGNTQLFRDSGGLAMLKELGASPSEIRQVQTAAESYDKAQINRFNLDGEKWKENLVNEVATGKRTADEAGLLVEEAHANRQLTDEHAKSLFGEVMTAWRKRQTDLGTEFPPVPDAARRAVESTYRLVSLGSMTAEEASNNVRTIAEQYDIDPKDVEKFIGEMWAVERTKFNKDVTDVEKAEAERQKLLDMTSEVRTALSNGFGLNTITGTVGGISAQALGVTLLKTETAKLYADGAEKLVEQGFTPDDAQREVDALVAKDVYANLRKQDVVDKDLQAAMTSASVGNVIGPDGKINTATLDAFDMYMQLANNPNVGSAYMAKYFTDEDGRDMFMTAQALYTGDYSIEQAIYKASEMIANKANKAGIDPVPAATVRTAITEQITNRWDELWDKSFFDEYNMSDEDLAAGKVDFTDVQYRVNNLAQVYNMQGLMPDVAAKKAAIDVMNNSSMIGGNIVYGNSKQGTRLDQVMGLATYSKDTADKAVRMWLEKTIGPELDELTRTGKDPTGRAQVWKDGTGTAMDIAFQNSGQGPYVSPFNLPKYKQPPYKADYDPNSGMLYIRLWKDEKRTELAKAAPIAITAASIGAWYKKETDVNSENWFQDMLGSLAPKPAVPVRDFGAEVSAANPDIAPPFIDAGAAISAANPGIQSPLEEDAAKEAAAKKAMQDRIQQQFDTN